MKSNGQKSKGVFLDGDSSNGSWQQLEETVMAMGNSDKQQEMAATAAVIMAKAMTTGRAAKEVTTAEGSRKVTAATTAKAGRAS